MHSPHAVVAALVVRGVEAAAPEVRLQAGGPGLGEAENDHGELDALVQGMGRAETRARVEAERAHSRCARGEPDAAERREGDASDRDDDTRRPSQRRLAERGDAVGRRAVRRQRAAHRPSLCLPVGTAHGCYTVDAQDARDAFVRDDGLVIADSLLKNGRVTRK